MRPISIRLSNKEKEHLDQYCAEIEMSLSDVIREMVRNLKVKGKSLETPALSASSCEPCTHQAENRLAG